jgi:hypothetical protein
VREATQQETRLIRTGKFRDVQRANVKLAVRFMVENYRLADALVQSAAYLEGGPARRVEAGQVGQGAVQSLVTILEYFDSSDVQNIKVRQDEDAQVARSPVSLAHSSLAVSFPFPPLFSARRSGTRGPCRGRRSWC